jgi:hypothetical protein
MRPTPRAALLAVLLAAIAAAVPAHGAPGLVVGVDDDNVKWTNDVASVVAAQRSLGVTADRVTLLWQPGQIFTDSEQQTWLTRAENAARAGQRIVLAIYGPAGTPPVAQADQDKFCAFAVDALRWARDVHDVVIWDEANSALFWKPQLGAAAAYESLLATCYDRLHAHSRIVNVISSTAPHENPGAFIEAVGAAYRATGRTAPIFDTFGHDAYPEVSTESPLATHPGTLSMDEGDYGRLLEALQSAFAGTGQPVPGSGNAPSGGFLVPGSTMSNKTGFVNGTSAGGPVTIWYLEDGFETVIPANERSAYTGAESNRQLVQPVSSLSVPGSSVSTPSVRPDQVSQLRDALELAYCQPAVGAWFNFQLEDDQSLSGWQSGLLYADGTPKPSYAAFKAEVAHVAARQVDCSRFASQVSGQAPSPSS